MQRQTKFAFKRLGGPIAIGGLEIPTADTLNKGLLMNNTWQLLMEIHSTEVGDSPKDDLFAAYTTALQEQGITSITHLL